MKIKDIFEETYAALLSNKARTGLTVLGIVIGIASVIGMVSIGKGAQSSIESSIQSIGSNLITVIPGVQGGPGSQVSTGRGSAKTLKISDADAIAENIQNINAVSPEVSSRYQVTAKGTNTNTTVVGVTENYPIVRNLGLSEGNFITSINEKNFSKVAVIGPTVRGDLFGEEALVIGKTIRIKNIQFTIVGVSEAKGGTGFNNPDDMIFIPLQSAQKYLTGDEYLSNISIQAKDSDSMSVVQEDVAALLLSKHKISDPTAADFSVYNQADILATASSVTDTFTILLGSVAGISLLVGGIGIMNMMLTTVTERTKEIGLRKAIGAKEKDINLQFLSEAVMLTFTGGVLGVMLGWVISYAVTYSGLIKTQVTLSSVVLAFGISALIGIVFGYYPARRAAKLNPIEALRYE